jgi:PAS domain S-box-containing protein
MEGGRVVVRNKKPIRGTPIVLFALALLVGIGLLALPLWASETSTSGASVLSVEDRAWLKTNGSSFRMCFNPEFPPIEFATEDGLFIGVGADVLNLLESRLGFSFERILYKDWNRQLADLENGTCAIAPSLVKTPERVKYAFFTTPYATVPVVIVGTTELGTKLSIDDLGGKRVAVVSGSAIEEYLRSVVRDRFPIVTLVNVRDGFRAVALGQVDAFVENLAAASYVISLDGITNLHVAGEAGYEFIFRLAVSRKYPRLYEVLQKGLDHVTPTELNKVRSRWISLGPERGLSKETIRWLVAISVFVLLLVIGLTSISALLKRRLNDKINTLRAAQSEVVKSEARFRSLFMQAPLPLIEISQQGAIVQMNDSASRAFGYRVEDVPLLDDWLRLAHADPSDREQLQRAWERTSVDSSLDDHASDPFEFEVRSKDGSTRAFLVGTSQVGEDTVVSLVDIDDRKRAEEQLRHSQKMLAVGQLAGGIAHDFNNLLGGIIGAAELLNDLETADANRRKLLEMIISTSERAAELTAKLLAFSRKQTIHMQTTEIHGPIKDAAALLERTVDRRTRFVLDFADEPIPVEGDRSQLQNAFLNLLLNAAQAMPEGGKITVTTRQVIFDAATITATGSKIEPGPHVEIEIRDTGTGIPPENVPRIFEPFFTTKEVDAGTGLGLAAVIGTIEQHQGVITVESTVGKGTTFRILLPITAEPFSSKVPQPSVSVTGRGRILIIDDEPAVRDTSAMLLRERGYEVRVAEHGLQGLKIFAEENGAFDLVIVDMIMPIMNGRDCLAALRRVRADMPVVLSSGYAQEEDIESILADGFDDFIRKPFRGANLVTVVERALGKK